MIKKIINFLKTPLELFFFGGFLFIAFAVLNFIDGNAVRGFLNLHLALFFAISYLGTRISKLAVHYFEAKKLETKYHIAHSETEMAKYKNIKHALEKIETSVNECSDKYLER